MPLDQLQHVNIRCADLERSRDFYVHVLGLVDGDRPPFTSRGHWLYLGVVPVIHLVARTTPEAVTGGGAIHHIAFGGTDLDAVRARLTAGGVSYREEVVPRDGAVQLFVLDPDGIQIELNFAP